MQIEHDITSELEQWGFWAQDCPMRSLNYPNTSGLMAIKGGVGISITDKRAVEIDQAIAHLFGKDKQAAEALKLRFVCGMYYSMIGKKLGISTAKAHSVVDNCVMWLNGYFFVYDK